MVKEVCVLCGNQLYQNFLSGIKSAEWQEFLGLMKRYHMQLLLIRAEQPPCSWTDAEGLLSDQVSEEEAASVCITDIPEAVHRLRCCGRCAILYLTARNRSMDLTGISYAVESLEGIDEEYLERVYLRFQKKPWEILRTRRLLVRETVPDDVEVLYSVYADAEITRYTEGPNPDPDVEREYLAMYAEHVYAFYGFGIWLLTDRQTGEVVGRAGFAYREGMDLPEIGFVIAAPFQRRGYAYEVCTALLEYGVDILGFEQIQALVMEENEASKALCEKLGFWMDGESEIKGRRYLRYLYTGISDEMNMR